MTGTAGQDPGRRAHQREPGSGRPDPGHRGRPWLLWALIRANSVGWGRPQITVTLAAGVLLAFGFIAWELRAADPMVPMHRFRSRAFAAGNAAAFCVFAVLLALIAPFSGAHGGYASPAAFAHGFGPAMGACAALALLGAAAGLAIPDLQPPRWLRIKRLHRGDRTTGHKVPLGHPGHQNSRPSIHAGPGIDQARRVLAKLWRC